jgi:uncharacterized FAD-dependent dehydrogenase
MVVAIEPSDYPTDVASWQAAFGEADGLKWATQAQAMAQQTPKAYHPLSGIVFQRTLESKAFVAGGENYTAPGQLVGDFLVARASKDFGEVQPSYKPGVSLGDLSEVLPSFAIEAMREALPVFGRKIKGYDMKDAVLTGVETRTSSPLKMTRGEHFQSLNTRGLYPAGEGASYAGGILSAGVDGIKIAEAIASKLSQAST